MMDKISFKKTDSDFIFSMKFDEREVTKSLCYITLSHTHTHKATKTPIHIHGFEIISGSFV